MSKKEKEEKAVAAEKKVVTKYDLKMQRRALEKEKEKREKRMTTGLIIAVLLVIVGLVAYAPISTQITLRKTFITVEEDGVSQDITKVEYDYNYHIVENNYINTYGSYLSYFGLDTSQDFSTQMYSETLTWKDYFDQLTVDNIKKTKALKKDAEDKGFVYNTDEEYSKFVENLEAAADEHGESVKNYVQEVFGPYATLSRIEDYVKDDLFVAAYNEKLMEDNKPSEEDIEAYYSTKSETYDSVDYKMTVINAQLPTEPTELAEEGAVVEEGVAYIPSEAEIAKAMEDAKVLADEAEATVKTEGTEYNAVRRADAEVVAKSWLFEEGRKAGDTTVIEDEDTHSYYVVYFQKRYRDESNTANVRVMALQENAQTVLDRLNEKGCTEEAFIELFKEYSVTSYENDGLFENISRNSLSEEFTDWIFAEGRKAGDAGLVEYDESTQYLMYYVSEGAAAWHVEIESEIVSQKVSDYIDALIAKVNLKDDKGNLNYLKVEAEEAAKAEAEAAEAESPEAEVTGAE